MTNSSIKSWIEDLDENLLNYVNTLKINRFEYLPMKSGLTREGQEIRLGFSCFALKIKYILNDEDIKSKEYLESAAIYLNSFQKNIVGFPKHSFIDDNFLYFHQHPKFTSSLKGKIKDVINVVSKDKYLDKSTSLNNFIRAETKQAISTIYQIGETNNLKYRDFPASSEKITLFLDNQNWKYPWNAGAQFSTLCVFSKTQLNNLEYINAKKNLENFLSKVTNKETGAYYKGNPPNSREIINGAMKVLTGLDWLNSEIHYPEKLIDFCLKVEIEHEGCDIVDLVYVLYKCSKQTNYRRGDVNQYLDNLLEKIKLHYVNNDGAFSYYFEASQKYYYGLNISRGLNTADIHGTLLLLWALSMIFETTDDYSKSWNILKP